MLARLLVKRLGRSFNSANLRSFPIEGFADIEVMQESKPIKLHSYKYPARTAKPKALALIMYSPF